MKFLYMYSIYSLKSGHLTLNTFNHIGCESHEHSCEHSYERSNERAAAPHVTWVTWALVWALIWALIWACGRATFWAMLRRRSSCLLARALGRVSARPSALKSEMFWPYSRNRVGGRLYGRVIWVEGGRGGQVYVFFLYPSSKSNKTVHKCAYNFGLFFWYYKMR